MYFQINPKKCGKVKQTIRKKCCKSKVDRHQNMKAIRLSMLDFIDQGWMTNYPLYTAGWMV
jgi:hypothetical protein